MHDGNKTEQTNELGKIWTWNYSELSQMTNAVDPLGRTTSYGHTFGVRGMSGVPSMILTPRTHQRLRA